MSSCRATNAKDRATDEELVAIGHAVSKARIFDGSSGGDETIAEWKRRLDLDVVRAVAARVRQECLVAQAVEAGGAHFYRLGPRKWAVYARGEGAECDAAADVPATLARLLGEVERG